MDNPDTLTTIMNRERKDDKKDYFDFWVVNFPYIYASTFQQHHS